jgi:transcriptional regulator with XRE-family HTH domain
VNLTFGERLELARSRANLTQEQLGERVNVGRNAVVFWEKDGRLPEGAAMVLLPTVLRVSGHWLLTGEGDMDVSEGTEAVRLRVIGRIVDGQISTKTLYLLARPEEPHAIADALADEMPSARLPRKGGPK